MLGLAPAAHAEAYVAGYVGGTSSRSADVTLERPGTGDRLVFRQVPFSGRSFDSPLYYGYRAGYFFTRHFGIEAEFIHLKLYAELDRPVEVRGTLQGADLREQAPMRRYADQFEVSHGLNMVLVNAVFRRALAGGDDPAGSRLVWIARGGLGPTVPRPEVIVFGEPGGAYQAGPVAVQGATGLEIRLWRGLGVLSEYKYTFTPSSFDIPNGRASVNVHSHHVVAGFAIHF